MTSKVGQCQESEHAPSPWPSPLYRPERWWTRVRRHGGQVQEWFWEGFGEGFKSSCAIFW